MPKIVTSAQRGEAKTSFSKSVDPPKSPLARTVFGDVYTEDSGLHVETTTRGKRISIVRDEVSVLLPSGGDDFAAWNAITSTGGRLLLKSRARYLLSASPQIASGAVVETDGEDFADVAVYPTWAPLVGSANDPTISLLTAASVVASSGTYLTSAAVRYSRTAVVASVGDLAVGDLVELRTTTAKGQDFVGNQTFADRVDILEIESINGTTLRFTTRVRNMHAGGGSESAGATVRKVTTPVRDIKLKRIRLDASGGTHPVGLRLDGVFGAELDLKVCGFSHAGVLSRRGTLGLKGANNGPMRLIYDGECNHAFKMEQTSAVKLQFESTGNGARFHANGVIGGLIHLTQRCSDIAIVESVIENGCTGIFEKGAVSLLLRDVVIENCDLTERVVDGRFVPEELLSNPSYKVAAAGLEMNGGNSNINTQNEQGRGVVLQDVVLRNCVVPASDFTQGAGLLVDHFEMSGRLFVENTGRTGNVIVGTAPYARGIIIWDDSGADLEIVTQGVEGAFIPINNWQNNRLRKLRIYGVDATNECVYAIINGMDAASPALRDTHIVIDHVEISSGAPWWLVAAHPGYYTPNEYSWGRFFFGIVTYNGRIARDVRLLKNVVTESAPNDVLSDGQIVEMTDFAGSGASVGMTLPGCRTATNADPTGKGAVLLTNASITVPLNSFAAVAFGSVMWARVKKADAVAPGQRLYIESGTRELTTTAGAFPAFGVARNAKPSQAAEDPVILIEVQR